MLGDLVRDSLHNEHIVFRCIILQNGLLLQTMYYPTDNFCAM